MNNRVNKLLRALYEELQGSEKQVKWAADIIDGWVGELERTLKYIGSPADRKYQGGSDADFKAITGERVADVHAAIAALRDARDARVIISNRRNMVTALRKLGCKADINDVFSCARAAGMSVR